MTSGMTTFWVRSTRADQISPCQALAQRPLSPASASASTQPTRTPAAINPVNLGQRNLGLDTSAGCLRAARRIVSP